VANPECTAFFKSSSANCFIPEQASLGAISSGKDFLHEGTLPRRTESKPLCSDAKRKAVWREIVGANGTYGLRDAETCYEADFGPKKGSIRQENAFFEDISL
jgi:hypothetical protein